MSEQETRALPQSASPDSPPGTLRALLRSLTDGVFLVDNAGLVQVWNPALAAITQLPAAETLGQPFEAVIASLTHSTDEPETLRHDLLGAARQVAEQPVVYLTLRQPAERLLQVQLFPVEDAHGTARGWGGLVRDLSRADQTNVLVTVVHELRTPLAALKGYVSSLLSNYGRWDAATIEAFLKTIDESADQLSGLVENVLDMSRLEAGLLQLQRRPVDLADLIAREAAALGLRAPRHRFDLRLPETLPQPLADPVRLAQAVRNLLHNAVKYSPSGGKITVTGEAGRHGLTIRVRDEGIGVPPEERERIFDRFYQAENAHTVAASGAGVGLYLSRRIIEAHGGRIWAEAPEDGPGSVFVFQLPTGLEGPPVRQAPPAQLAAGPSTGEARVLVVEDDRRLARFVKANLEASGYEVMTVADGADAVVAVGRERPDLVLLDLGLPTLDGYAVCEQVREFSNVPIIILTARVGEADLVRALDSGADDYLTKPFGTQALLARVRAVLRRGRIPEEVQTQPTVAAGDLTIDFARREVRRDGQTIGLTPTEYKLLYYLALNAGQTLTHEQLLYKVWGTAYESERAYLWVYISRLRKKIEPDPENPRYILSEPSVGYRFEAD